MTLDEVISALQLMKKGLPGDSPVILYPDQPIASLETWVVENKIGVALRPPIQRRSE